MDEDFVAFGHDEEKDQGDEAGGDAAPALLTSVPASWLAYAYQYDKRASPLVRLHNEILACCEYLAPSKHEMNLREVVLAEITDIIQGLWPQSTVQVFGSQMTKILTPTSDLDLVVMGVVENKRDNAEIYRALAEKIRDSGLVSYVEAIVNAKVPIVKLDHKKTGIAVDICINNDSGLRTGRLIRKFVKEYPPLRPLVLVLKVFLTQRRMNETYSGGIGSFLLTLMIVNFMQHKQRLSAPRRGSSDNSLPASLPPPSWNLGTLLLEFFHLYGVTLNYFSAGISVPDGGSYLAKRKRGDLNSGRPNLLYLENPDSPDLDIGRNSYMMPKIRRSFEHAHQLLTAALGDPRVPSYLAYVIRADDPALQDRPGPELGAQRSNADALR